MERKPIHPGEILLDELTEMGLSVDELAETINLTADGLSKIIAGKRSISVDTARQLGKWFGTGPKIWINLQQAYEMDLVKWFR